MSETSEQDILESPDLLAEAAPLAEPAGPVQDASRIESLDVLRGFALLGILLINILAFGLPYAALSNPGFDLAGGRTADVIAWAATELFAEGAMRALFSMLFGAGVVLFTTGAAAKSRSLHYRRTFFLLLIGLFDAYVLLWLGDILVNYAVAGAILFWFRNMKARWLYVWAAIFTVLISLVNFASGWSLSAAEKAYQEVQASENPEELSELTREFATVWEDFKRDYQPTEESLEEELEMRRGSYVSAFKWNVPKTNEMMFMILPMIMLWDAIAMMLLGMAFYKTGVLQGRRSPRFYLFMSLAGFAVGFAFNLEEVSGVLATDFSLLAAFGQMQWTYHLGRLGLAMGYMGLIVLICQKGVWTGLRMRLAAVGKMALTNYMMHSVICLFLFTGAGFALIGTMGRAELYLVVLGIWIFQLILSPIWLRIFQYGPAEWLWRGLTYKTMPPLLRRS